MAVKVTMMVTVMAMAMVMIEMTMTVSDVGELPGAGSDPILEPDEPILLPAAPQPGRLLQAGHLPAPGGRQ